MQDKEASVYFYAENKRCNAGYISSTGYSFLVNYIIVGLAHASPNYSFTPDKVALITRQTPAHSPLEDSAHLHRTSSPSISSTGNREKQKRFIGCI